MTQAGYAVHRNVSEPYISKLKSKGVLVMAGRLVDMAASDAVLDDKPVTAGASEQEPATLREAQRQESIWRGRLRRLEWERESQNLLPAQEVEINWSDIAIRTQNAVMGIPARIVNRLPSEWRREVEVVATDEMRQLLAALGNEIRSNPAAP